MSEMKYPIKGFYRAMLIKKKKMAYNEYEGCYCLIGPDDVWVSAKEVLGDILKYGNKIHARIVVGAGIYGGRFEVIRIDDE